MIDSTTAAVVVRPASTLANVYTGRDILPGIKARRWRQALAATNSPDGHAARPQSQRDRMLAFGPHPATFISGVLGARLSDHGVQMCCAIARPKAHVAVAGCHASTKTFTAAGIGIHWIVVSDDTMVITTAPTWNQVKRVMFPEMHKARIRRGIGFPRINQTELGKSGDNLIVGISTNDATRFQGFHGKILVLVDEAPGVFQELWEAISGIEASGDVRVLALGNPTEPSGPFFDIFHTKPFGWRRISIDALATENFVGTHEDRKLGREPAPLSENDLMTMPEDDPRLDYNPIEYMVGRRWAWTKIREWGGPDSPVWQARGRGQFPAQTPGSLFMNRYLTAAEQPTRPLAGEPCAAGIDVAGPGADETVLTVYGQASGRILSQIVWTIDRPVGECKRALEPYRRRLRAINIDATGIGWYFYDAIEEDFPGITHPVNFADAPVDDPDGIFADRKAELYVIGRTVLEHGMIHGLTDALTRSQLAGVHFAINRAGKIEIEDKKLTKKRTGMSPDRAESLLLAVQPLPGGSFAGSPADLLRARQFGGLGVGVETMGVSNPAGRRALFGR